MYGLILTAALAAGPEAPAQLLGPYGVVPRTRDRLAFDRLARRGYFDPYFDPRFRRPRFDPRFDPRFRDPRFEFRFVFDPRTGEYRLVRVPRRWW